MAPVWMITDSIFYDFVLKSHRAGQESRTHREDSFP